MPTECKTIANISDADLAAHINAGWDILHMEFVPVLGAVRAGQSSAALCVVFQRETEPAPAPPPGKKAEKNPAIDRAIDEVLGMFAETVIEDTDAPHTRAALPPGCIVIGVPPREPAAPVYDGATVHPDGYIRKLFGTIVQRKRPGERGWELDAEHTDRVAQQATDYICNRVRGVAQ